MFDLIAAAYEWTGTSTQPHPSDTSSYIHKCTQKANGVSPVKEHAGFYGHTHTARGAGLTRYSLVKITRLLLDGVDIHISTCASFAIHGNIHVSTSCT